MRKIVSFFCILAAALCLASCRRGVEVKYPLFWTWFDYHPGITDFEAACDKLDAMGIEGMVLNAPSPDDYREVIPIAHAHGIKVIAWLWTLNIEHGREQVVAEHPEWFSVNRLGESLADPEKRAYVDYYTFMCPALPEVREFLNDRVRSYCEVDGLDGIAIDYHRLVDVVLPTSLWSRYGIIQDKEYPQWDYGYHPAMIEKFVKEYGYDPREQEDPAEDLVWRQFRCDQVTEVANMLAQTIHSYGKLMSASPFPTPKMSARMVRQDWGKWDLDLVFPMAYHSFYTFDPSFDYDCTVENMRDKMPKTDLFCGIHYDKDDITACMDAAFAGGAQGICIFIVDNVGSQEEIDTFRAYTDSVKAIVAANGGRLPKVRIPKAADSNPFNHPGVMRKVEEKMASLIGADSVRPGGYRFIRRRGIAEDYEVQDLRSGEYFLLTFYFYGDMISGWDLSRKDRLVVRKLDGEAPEPELLGKYLDAAGVEYVPLDCFEWTDLYPYTPDVKFRIAHNGHEILLNYLVKENDILAASSANRGSVYTDSCVEFFISTGGDREFYNFESNSIGAMFIQYGDSDFATKHRCPQEVYDSIKRWGSMGTEPFGEKFGDFCWEYSMVIPVGAFWEDKLESLDGLQATANFYKCGNNLKNKHFASWTPTGYPKPGFHHPESFGFLFFE